MQRSENKREVRTAMRCTAQQPVSCCTPLMPASALTQETSSSCLQTGKWPSGCNCVSVNLRLQMFSLGGKKKPGGLNTADRISACPSLRLQGEMCTFTKLMSQIFQILLSISSMLQSMVHKPSRLVVKLLQILYQALCSLFFLFCLSGNKLNPLLAK